MNTDKVKEIAERITEEMWSMPFGTSHEQAKEFLAEKLAAELEKFAREAREGEFARGQELKATCVCSSFGPCELHRPIIENARRETLEQAAKVAAEHDCSEDCKYTIEGEIRKLMTEVKG